MKAAVGAFVSSKLIYILIFVIGAAAFLYPFVTNLINLQMQTRIISNYDQEMAALEKEQKESLLREAQEYNAFVAGLEGNVTDEITDTERETGEVEYVSVLSASNAIGYISIPKIDVDLPIFRGTSDEVLSLGVGHLERSSLPVGGTSSHSVLVGHRGLPTARLFRDLDMLEEGDTFYINVADETLAYEVESVQSVLPNEVESLRIQEGRDLCTLVTCDPYMVNSHRLLVTAHRTDYVPEQSDEVEGHISFLEKYREFFAIVGVFSFLWVLVWLIRRTLRRKEQQLVGNESVQ